VANAAPGRVAEVRSLRVAPRPQADRPCRFDVRLDLP